MLGWQTQLLGICNNMTNIKLSEILRRLTKQLSSLEEVAIAMIAEIAGRRDIQDANTYVATLNDPLLRLALKWKGELSNVLNVSNIDSELDKKTFSDLEYLLGYMQGLGRDFDMDISWSKWDKKLFALIGDVSMTALAARFILFGDKPPEVTRANYEKWQ
jgi:hypothetical protein